MTLGYGHGIDGPFAKEAQGADCPFDAPEEAQGIEGPLLDPGQGPFGSYGEAGEPYLPGWEGLCG